MRWLDGITVSMDPKFEQALGDGEEQGSLACLSPWGCKASDMTERLKLSWAGWSRGTETPSSCLNNGVCSSRKLGFCGARSRAHRKLRQQWPLPLSRATRSLPHGSSALSFSLPPAFGSHLSKRLKVRVVTLLWPQSCLEDDRDFVGGPVAKTQRSQCRGPGFHPWSRDPICRN